MTKSACLHASLRNISDEKQVISGIAVAFGLIKCTESYMHACTYL